MARPRTPSNVLDLRGSFAKHPERRRTDAEGAGPFNPEPPAHMPEECRAAWAWICARLPKVSVYSTDEIAVEITARLLTAAWRHGTRCDVKLLAELRGWMKELGMTVQARTTLPAAPDRNDDANPFAKVGHDKP